MSSVQKNNKDVFDALDAATNWILFALSVSKDSGVPQAYFVSDRRWATSYPETTGYIIPTFFDYHNLIGEPAYREHAIKMAHWECDVQLPEGAVRAGTMDTTPVRPTIFNTGQVLFGWARAYTETRDVKFLKSLISASDWLCDVQDDDGCWRKFGSTQTLNTLNTYNTRSAWGLIEAYKVTKNERYRECAVKNLEWALKQQIGNGWWKNNCLLDNTKPFTHTIAYAMRGFIEIGDSLKREDFITAALKAARAVRKKQRDDGSWAGQYNRFWWAKSEWSCLTGNSQLAINFIRLYEITGDKSFFLSAQMANKFNMSIQDLDTHDLNVRGGIPGSWPINGKYHPNQYPNWAAKFFADALMCELKHTAGAEG